MMQPIPQLTLQLILAQPAVMLQFVLRHALQLVELI